MAFASEPTTARPRRLHGARALRARPASGVDVARRTRVVYLDNLKVLVAVIIAGHGALA